MNRGAGTSGVGPVGGASRSLDLLVPGLLGPISIPPEDIPAAPDLERLLSRGTPLPGGGVGLTESLFSAFGLDLADRGEASGQAGPSAPLCYLADAPHGDQGGYRLHADPVHLRLDRDRLLLYDARHLDLSQAEANALVGLFNVHFAAEGLTMEAPVPGRWYLRLTEAPGLHTQPIDAVVGRSVAPCLPTGTDARRWVRILNEVQMLFSQAEINRRREADGRLPVSGIWPWGGGELSSLQPLPRYRAVFADHPLSVGLARRAGVALHPLTGVERGLAAAVADGPVLVVWDRLWPAVLDADPLVWSAELVRLEDWLGQVQGLLGSRRLHHWTLNGCHGNPRRIARRDAWRLWRRVRPLARMLAGV
jgi:hypothetical protein